MSDETQRRIEEFWIWFVAHKEEFSRLTLDDPFWDAALQRVKKVDENLWLELSRDSDPAREFIITAEGHVNSFPAAEELVRSAPDIAGWIFIALKPPQGFQFVTTYEGTRFDPRKMWFLPLVRESHPGDLGIRIAVAGLDCMDRRLAHNAVLVILDTAIGERSAALDIQHTEVTELPPDPQSEGYIELPELTDYIARRKRRLSVSSV